MSTSNDSSAGRGQRPPHSSPSSASSSSGSRRPLLERSDKPCNKGSDCRRADCRFKHPQGWNPNADRVVKQCNFGMKCTRPDCWFAHPPGRTSAVKYVSISSGLCGQGLVHKLRTYHGDNLEGLQAVLHSNAAIAYSDEDHCLTVQLPQSEAFTGEEKLKQEIETGRKRLAGEWNELNVVGNTRIVIGRGGALRTVLTENECISITAKMSKTGDSNDNNQASGSAASIKQKDTEMVRSIFNIMKQFDDKVVVHKIARKNDFKLTFNTKDAAQSALIAYPDGPWSLLVADVQRPRVATIVQVSSLMITYPLKVQLTRERRVIIAEMLKLLGVNMSDVHVFPGDKVSATGKASVRMRSPSDVQDAVRLLHNSRNYPHLSGKTPLIAEGDVSFSADVPKRTFRAIWVDLFGEKTRAARAGVKISLTEMPYQGVWAVKIHWDASSSCGRSKEESDALWKAVKSTRANVEKLLEGSGMDFDRNSIHLLGTKEGASELHKLCRDVDLPVSQGAPPDQPRCKSLAIICEKESSRIRLFGPRDWVADAKQMIKALEASLKFTEQMGHLRISNQAAEYLSTASQANRLAQIAKDVGAVSCELSRTNSGTVVGAAVAVKGTPSSISQARIHIKHLETDAKAGSSTYLSVGGGYVDTTGCPVCLCEIEPEEQVHIMEPCGHAYHASYAQSLMQGAQLPISCCKHGCKEPVCMEDIKLCLGEAAEYQRALDRAFNNFINQNSDKFGRCYSLNCKQVFSKEGAGTIRFDCDHCMESYCSTCHVKWHEGQSCKQYQDQLRNLSRNEHWVNSNTRPCPNCTAPFYKDGGCNRLQCTNCKTYICNICVAKFDTTTDCYRHLTAEHGGYFT